MNFKRLYLIMMNAAEKGLDALDANNYGIVREQLLGALNECENLYTECTEDEQTEAEHTDLQ